MMYTEDQVNEKVMQGKIMEVQGRTMVATGSGPLSTQVKASQPMGKALMAMAKPRAVPTSAPTTTAAHRTTSAPPTPLGAGATPMSVTSRDAFNPEEETTDGSWQQLNDDLVNQTAVPKSGYVAPHPKVKPQAKPKAAASLEA